MNPLTNMKNVKRLGEQELRNQNPKSSWHNQYKDSAWIFVGGLPYELTEGDIICVFSQYGEIVNINYVRDKITGKPKGFCFICFEDQKSTILAVDNLNGIKILGRIIRIDHVQDYKPPKDSDKLDPESRQIITEGCAPKSHHEPEIKIEPDEDNLPNKKLKKVKKEKKVKSKKSKKSKHKKRSSSSSSSDSEVEKKSKKSKTKKVKRKDSSSESLSEGEKEILAVKEKRKQLAERLKSLEEVIKRKSLSNSNKEVVGK